MTTFDTKWVIYHQSYKPTIIGRYFKKSYTMLFQKSFPSVSKNAIILDVGCGSGYFMNLFRQEGYMRSIGIDLAYSGLLACQRDYNLIIGKDVYQMDALHTSFPSESFDVVFSEGILEHFSRVNFAKCIAEMCRVSRDYVVIIQPNFSSVVRCVAKVFWETFYDSGVGVREYPYLLREFEFLFSFYGFPLFKKALTVTRENAVLVFRRKR